MAQIHAQPDTDSTRPRGVGVALPAGVRWGRISSSGDRNNTDSESDLGNANLGRGGSGVRPKNIRRKNWRLIGNVDKDQ